MLFYILYIVYRVYARFIFVYLIYNNLVMIDIVPILQAYITDPAQLRAHALKNPSALGASYEAADQFGWDLVVPIEAVANPSGKLTDEAFETIVGQIVDAWDSSFDGALLHLHGAMVTERYEDAEGEILRRLRAKHSNPGVPIIVTLDLHGNITEQMATNASCLIAVRTYPHIDFYERSWQGAKLLQRAMMGEICLRTVIGARKPLLRGLDGGRTQKGPMRELIDRGCALEERNEVCVVSVCAGFSAADIYDIGPSVTVTVDTKEGEESALRRAQSVADEFTDYAWQQRAYTSVNHIDVPSAIALAQAEQADPSNANSPPLILAEVTDNPGSGHYGDAVNLLKAMVGSGAGAGADTSASGLVNAALYAIYDPEAVQAGIAIGEGNEGSITMGGRHDVTAGGEPITLFGKVLRITDGTCSASGPMAAHVASSGPSMAFRCRGVDIAVISNNGQPYDVAQLEALGIDFRSKTTVALKSNHHFRASFEPLARKVVTVDGGGLGHTILFGGSYKHVRRPIWPLDDIPL